MADTDDDSLERAREDEQLHRRLQQQGETTPEDVPRRERERHEAIDEAMQDAERSVRRAHERESRAEDD